MSGFPTETYSDNESHSDDESSGCEYISGVPCRYLPNITADTDLGVVREYVESDGPITNFDIENIYKHHRLDIFVYLYGESTKARHTQGLLACSWDLDMELRRAIDHGDIGVIEFLIEQGANPDRPITGRFNEFPLYHAALRGQAHVVKLFLDKGYTTNERDVYHAFFRAIVNRHIDVVKVFMEHGCDVHADDDELIHLSFRAETLDIFKLLTKDGTDIVNDYVCSNILCEAACENLTDFVVFFLEKKDNGVFNFDINKAMAKVVKLLGNRYYVCDTTIIKHLIDAGADDSCVPKDILNSLYGYNDTKPAMNI